MRKLYLTLALVLCLAFVVFAFASCGKGKKPASTTDPSACVHEWGEYVVEVQATCKNAGLKARYCKKCNAQDPEVIEIPTIAHTESADYKTISAPTCKDVGWETKYCTQCFSNLDDTLKEIPADVNAHEPGAWTVVKQPTLLDPTDGSRTATCKLCQGPLNEKLTWVQPFVLDSGWNSTARSEYNQEHGVDWLNHKDNPDGIHVRKSVNAIKADDEHYYPDESNGNAGNDLLVEVSFLWNSTLAGLGTQFTFAHVDGYDVFNVGSTIVPKERSGYTYHLVAGTKNKSIDEYGWHRLGFRVHQEAEIDNSGAEPEVKYTYIATAYLDGELAVSMDMTDYVVRRTGSNTALIFTAEIEDNELVYSDVERSSFALLIFEEFFTNAGSYCVFADLEMSCGQDFKQQVEPNTNPADAEPFNVAQGVDLPAKIYYKAK